MRAVRGDGEGVEAVAVLQRGRADIVLAGDGAQTREQEIEAVRLGELRLEEATLCGLGLAGIGRESDADDAGPEAGAPAARG